MVRFGTTRDVRKFAKMTAEAGFPVKANYEAGTVQALDGPKSVFWALQQGRGGNWIMRFADTEHVTWTDPVAPAMEIVKKEEPI